MRIERELKELKTTRNKIKLMTGFTGLNLGYKGKTTGYRGETIKSSVLFVVK